MPISALSAAIITLHLAEIQRASIQQLQSLPGSTVVLHTSINTRFSLTAFGEGRRC